MSNPFDGAVFILGAGASKPYGFPCGKSLRTEILDLENHHPDQQWSASRRDHYIFLKHLKEFGYSLNDLKDFLFVFRGTGAETIDEFLLEHSGDDSFYRLGQLITYYMISSNELHRNLNESDWIETLIGFYMSSQHRESFVNNPPRFITFNYDNYLNRKIEFILTKRFKLTDYKKPEIIHVYGKTSGSSFDKDSQNMDLIVDKSDIYENSKNISLIRKTPDMNIRLQINDLITTANRVILLGYGFHRPNNNLLFGSTGLRELVFNNKLIGTGLNLPEGILNSIHSHAKRPEKFPIKSNMDCQTLIKSLIPVQV